MDHELEIVTGLSGRGRVILLGQDITPHVAGFVVTSAGLTDDGLTHATLHLRLGVSLKVENGAVIASEQEMEVPTLERRA
jgi:hypothetical protein